MYGLTSVNFTSSLATALGLFRNVTEDSGTLSYDETAAGEQQLLEVVTTVPLRVSSIWIDMVNVTQNTTIRLYEKIDGTNYRLFQTSAWVVADDDGVLLDGFSIIGDFKVTLQCGGGGGGSVNVPYGIV